MRINSQKLIDQLTFWCRKDVSGFGIDRQVITKLVQAGRVNDIRDIYKLSLLDFNNIEKIKEDKAIELCKRVREHRSMLLWKVIYGLQMPGIGIDESKYLADHYKAFERFIQYAFLDVNQGKVDVQAFGFINDSEEFYAQLVEWYRTGGHDLVFDLIQMTWGVPSSFNPLTTYLKGKSVFVKGKFKKFLQKDLIDALKSMDVVIAETIGAADYVLLGSHHGEDPSKASATALTIYDNPNEWGNPAAQEVARDSFYNGLGLI